MCVRCQFVKLFIPAAFAMTAVSGQAQDFIETEACELEMNVETVVDWRGLYGRGYEVFDPTDNVEVIMLEIRHVGPPCEFFLTASSSPNQLQPSLIGPSDELAFDLRRDPSGPSIISPDFFGDQFSRLEGQFGSGLLTMSVPLYLAIPPLQAVGGGSYSGQPILRLFRDNPGAPDLMDEIPIDVLVPVPAVLSVELQDASPGVRSLEIDLGSLSQSIERTTVFDIRSNASVYASIASQNRGLLAHFAGAPGIPYRLFFGDGEVNLDAPSAVLTLPNTRTLTTPVPLYIRVNGNAYAAAGQYSDTLTVTFVVE